MEKQRPAGEYQLKVEAFVADSRLLLKRLQNDVEQAQVWVRPTTHVDMVLGAHLSRIFNTTKTVLLLCDLDNAHDAVTLARTVLEHTVSLSYLCEGDSAQRCTAFLEDAFTQAGSTHLAAGKYFSAIIDPLLAQKAIEAGELAGHQGKFARQISDLITGGNEEAFGFMRDILYPTMSAFAHPHSHGLDSVAPIVREPFRIRQASLPHESAGAAMTVISCCVLATVTLQVAWAYRSAFPYEEDLTSLRGKHKVIRGEWYDKFLLPQFVPKRKPKKKRS